MAQQSTGGLRGRVLDAAGAPVAGVRVELVHADTAASRGTRTGKDGAFRFDLLPVGIWNAVIHAPAGALRLRCQVHLGQVSELPVMLAQGAGATVEVGEARDTVARIRTRSAEVGMSVGAERLESLPVLSRNVVQATVLAAGVQVIAGGQVDPMRKASLYMTQGDSQGRGTSFNLDGGDNNATSVGGDAGAVPLDAIAEFQVVTSQYKAEFGRSNAGFLNVVSKAGGNRFAGSVHAQYTDQALRARGADEGRRRETSSLHAGATVSGPILPDRLFFMASAERREEAAPASTFAPIAQATFPETRGLQTRIDATTLYARLDWRPGDALDLTLTFGHDRNDTPNQSFGVVEFFNGIFNTAGLGYGRNETERVGLKVSAVSGSAAWESRFLYLDTRNHIRPLEDALGLDGCFWVRRRSSAVMPIPLGQLGGAGFEPNAFQESGLRRLQWRNDLTLVLGAHTWKGGLDLQRTAVAEAVSYAPFTGITALSLVDVAWGPAMYGADLRGDWNVVRALLQARNVFPGDRIGQLGAYLQDDWEPDATWSFHLGLRADRDGCFGFLQAPAIRAMYADIHARNPAFLHGAEPPKDRTYLSPRFQAAFRPFGDDRTAYTFGYGRFVANVVDNLTGYARTLLARSNGIPGAFIGNAAAIAATGASPGSYDLEAASFAQGAAWNAFAINGHHVVLPADLTPYNLAHDVHGLRTYFRTTVDGWLLPASFSTGGKQLLASDFRYPVTDTFSVSGAWRFGSRHSLDLTFLLHRTRHASTQFTADASSWRNGSTPTPEVSSFGPGGASMGDNIYLSNQASRIAQANLRYAYASEAFQVLFNLVCKDARSTYGGAGGAFDQVRTCDFYGRGALTPWVRGSLRRSHGTEVLSGSFAAEWRAPWGSRLGLLGTWHGPKYYDMFLGYNVDLGPVGYTNTANSNTYVGQGTGAWNLDLGLRVSHAFRLGRRLRAEPFLLVQNLLNNFDYGTNYFSDRFDAGGNPNPDVGRRMYGWQANLPRMAALGLRVSF